MRPIRVIPCLDINEGRVVKGVHFVDLQDTTDPVEAAQAYSDGGADEIAFLDITATVERRRTVFDLLRRVTAVVKVPVPSGAGSSRVRTSRASLEARGELSRRSPAPRSATRRWCGRPSSGTARSGCWWPSTPTPTPTAPRSRGSTSTGAARPPAPTRSSSRSAWRPGCRPTAAHEQGNRWRPGRLRHAADPRHCGRRPSLPVIASGGAGKLDTSTVVAEGHADAVLAALCSTSARSPFGRSRSTCATGACRSICRGTGEAEGNG